MAAMVDTVCHLPAFLSLLSPKLVFSDLHQQPKLRWTAVQHRPPPLHSALRASSVKKRTRKVKTNEELCDELQRFLTAVGLPEGHVPSLKDLSQHGRNDLANIVRRRGYKLIRELLTEATKTDVNGNANIGVAQNQVAIVDREDIVTGQDQEVNDVTEDFSSRSEVSVLESSSGRLIAHPDPNHDDSVPVESSVDSYNLEGHSEQVDNEDVNGYVSTRVPIMENHSSSSKVGLDSDADNHGNMPSEISTNPSLEVVDDFPFPTTVTVKENKSFSSNIGWDLNSDERPSMPVESATGFSSDGKVLDGSQDGEVDNMAEEDSLSTKVSVTEDHSSCSNLEPTHNSDQHSYAPLESPANLSLEDKVANFMQNGDLDTLEDNVYGTLSENDTEETKGESGSGNTEEVQLRIPTPEHSKNVLHGSDATMEFNRRTSTSKTVDPSLRDDSSSDEGLSSLSDKDLDDKTSEREGQHDFNHIKLMLHQKEMELSWLKEQIEREKRALSMLQTKAETAISKARQLVSEKDAELLAAEESLSGLVEVEIQYRGDGEIVEVTGSFNGWHHQIKMDPQPSSSIIDPIGLRKSRLWSTMLWLYPGVYEIKFIVDGQWKIDPQRESVTRGTICNNILRVDR